MFSRIERAMSRLKNAFLEDPWVAVSVERACRLRGLDESSCYALLAALEHAGFLWRTYDGHFRLHPEAVMAEARDRE
jgi:DNA-binding IclR family transcriptional regulator